MTLTDVLKDLDELERIYGPWAPDASPLTREVTASGVDPTPVDRALEVCRRVGIPLDAPVDDDAPSILGPVLLAPLPDPLRAVDPLDDEDFVVDDEDDEAFDP